MFFALWLIIGVAPRRRKSDGSLLKMRAPAAGERATVTLGSGSQPHSLVTGKAFPMMTKACTNTKCPAYAHFVYTVAMRCVLCRCDLKSAQRISEAIADAGERARPEGTALSTKSAASSFSVAQ